MFNLMEKEWRMLNSQVFATIVVLTNRGVVPEEERFGVKDVEPVARSLANANRSAAGCNIPEVGGPTSKRKGNGPVVGIILAGGITLGGIEVWRRKKKWGKGRQPPPPKIAPAVPPQCQGIAQQVDKEGELVSVLTEASIDLGSDLERADRIHKNNLVKARIVINLEIITAVATPAVDLAVALRPGVLRAAKPGVLGQMDGWKPPMNLNPRLAQMLEAAEAAVAAAMSKFRALADEAHEFASSISRRVEELPSVKNARMEAEVVRNHLGELEKALPECTNMRGQIATLERAGETISDELAMWRKTLAQAEAKVAAAETKLNMSNNKLSITRGLEADISRLKQELEVASTLDDVAGKQWDLAQKQGQLTRELKDPAVQQAMQESGALTSQLAKEQADLAQISNFATGNIDRLGTESVAKMKERQDLLFKLHGAGDVLEIDVTRAQALKSKADQAAEDARMTGFNQFNVELTTKQTAAEAAGQELDAKSSLVNELRHQAVVGGTPGAPGTSATTGVAVVGAGAVAGGAATSTEMGIAGRTWDGVKTIVKYPFVIASELVFGVGQSPLEIMEILRSGKERVDLLRVRKNAVDRALREHNERLGMLGRQLTQCLKRAAQQTGHPVGGAGSTKPATKKSIFSPPKMESK